MNNDKIVKPATLLQEDLIRKLTDVCNSSGLPFFVVESVLKDLIQDVHAASKRQLEMDRANYNNELKKMQEQSEN